MLPLQLFHPPPPPPPPPPPEIEVVPDDELIEDPPAPPTQDFDPDLNKNTAPPPSPEPAIPPPPPPRPLPPKEDDNIAVIFVERMPLFPGCAESGTYAEQRVCSDQELVRQLYEEIRYPPLARENGVEGTVVLRFIIEKDGSLSSLEVIRDPGAGLGDEAVRAVTALNEKAGNWSAGKQNGRPVRVILNLPVKFELN